MDSLGLGFETLKLINPEIVMVSSQLVGSSGPNSHWTGYGPTTQTYGGLLHLWDYDDDDPPATNGTIFPDHAAGRLCALAGISALIGRETQSSPTHTEVAQVEVVVNIIAEQLLKEDLASGSTGPKGNFHPQRFRGPYQCAGEEQWVIISIETTSQWQALVNAMGSPEWAEQEILSTLEGRMENTELINNNLSQWVGSQNRDDVFHILQKAGVHADRC